MFKHNKNMERDIFLILKYLTPLKALSFKYLKEIAKQNGICKNKINKRKKNKQKQYIVKSLINKINNNAIIIQKTVRGFIIRKKLNYFQTKNRNKKFQNSTSLLGDNIDKIPYNFFYSHKEVDKYFAFDIRSLNILLNNDKVFKNPYTNLNFSNNDNKYILDRINELKNSNITLEIDEPNSLQAKIASFFVRLESFDIYSDIKSFLEMNVFDFSVLIDKIVNNNMLSRFVTRNQYFYIINHNKTEYLDVVREKIINILNSILDDNTNATTYAIIINQLITEHVHTTEQESYYSYLENNYYNRTQFINQENYSDEDDYEYDYPDEDEEEQENYEDEYSVY